MVDVISCLEKICFIYILILFFFIYIYRNVSRFFCQTFTVFFMLFYLLLQFISKARSRWEKDEGGKRRAQKRRRPPSSLSSTSTRGGTRVAQVARDIITGIGQPVPVRDPWRLAAV